MIELPIEIVDVSQLINQNLCLADGDGEFIITGQGGLSPSLAYQELGQLQAAQKAIASSLALLKNLPANDESDRSRAQVFNRQGRLLLSQGKPEQAWSIFHKAKLLYQQAQDQTKDLNDLNDSAQTLLPEINSLLSQLPISRSSIYARINFAQSLIKPNL